MMSLFFTLGSTVHDWGWPKNGPFWTKNGQTWQACQRSKLVKKGPKWLTIDLAVKYLFFDDFPKITDVFLCSATNVTVLYTELKAVMTGLTLAYSATNPQTSSLK